MAHSLLLVLFIAVGCSVCLVQCVPAPASRSRENLRMAKLLMRDLENMGHDDRHKLFEDIRTQSLHETSPYLITRVPLQMKRQAESPELSIGVSVALLRDLVRLREESQVREAAIEANEDDLEEIGKRRFD